MRTLDGKLVCPLCGHSRPAHGAAHKIGLRATAVLLGALLLPACGARTEPLERDTEPPAASAPLDAESVGVRLADALCLHVGCESAPISFSFPTGSSCESGALHAIANAPGFDLACATAWADALEAASTCADIVPPGCSLQH